MDFFRALTVFQLTDPAAADIDAMRRAIAKPFTPPSRLDWFSEGWVPPSAWRQDAYTFPPPDLAGGLGAAGVKLRRDDKILPASAIKQRLAERTAEIEHAENRKLGRKERLAIKEQITDDMLPQAFVKTRTIQAIVDPHHHWLFVDTASNPRAEELLSKLRTAAPPLPARSVRTMKPLQDVLTGWVAAGAADHGFALATAVVLQQPGEQGARARLQHLSLTDENVTRFIASGYRVTQLGLSWEDRLSFTLTDTLQLRGVRFLDTVREELHTQTVDADMAALAAATFTLTLGELRNIVTALVAAAGGLIE